MIDVQHTHRQAMEKADQAVAAQKAGDQEEATARFREACRLESEAAHALVDEFNIEPTRSVLFRSAASLAVETGQSGYAAYLVARGLEGSPPEEIREELRELLGSVRHQVERDRIGLYLSSCAPMQAAADRLRTALADRALVGRTLSGSVTHDILDATQDSLRAFTGDTSLSVDLFHVGDAELGEWVPLSPVERLSDWWLQFAKTFVLQNEDTLFQPRRIVCQFNESVTDAREAGILALAAYPVRAMSENSADRPAFVLLALASQRNAFAEELACQMLSQAASLLEIAIQIGRREEIFRLRDSSQ